MKTSCSLTNDELWLNSADLRPAVGHFVGLGKAALRRCFQTAAPAQRNNHHQNSFNNINLMFLLFNQQSYRVKWAVESFFYCSLYITGQRWSGRVSLMTHMNVAELVWRGNLSCSQISHVDWIKRNKLVTDLFMGFKIADVSQTVQWEVRKTEQRSRW